MAALEKPKHLCWATFRDLHDKKVYKPVEVVRTCWDHEPKCPYYWCTINDVGVWPGTDSPDWIEVVW